MASIPFVKLQGAGNDFIVLDNRARCLSTEQLSLLARRVCRRRLSLGADGLMAVNPPAAGGHLRLEFFNADGSLGEMCGNGARCLARYAFERGLAGEDVVIETAAGTVTARRLNRRIYLVRLNAPTALEPDRVVELDGKPRHCAYVELGSPGLPHAVAAMPGLAGRKWEDLRPLAAALRSHPAFPKGANVTFVDREADGRVRALTFERGVEDFTLACGTGAGAAAAVLTRTGAVPKRAPVELLFPGGALQVLVEDGGGQMELSLIGDTCWVAEGTLFDDGPDDGLFFTA